MALQFKLLPDKFDENKLSLFVAAIIDVFVIVEAGFKTDANCKRDCRRIDFDEKPNGESSLILANGLFFI